MKDYIEREPLLKIAKSLQGDAFGSPLIVKAIEEAPAEDVVKVVRCKDCWKRYKQCFEKTLEDDDYCSHGEKEEKPL